MHIKFLCMYTHRYSCASYCCLIVESFACCVKSDARKFISTVDANPFLAAKSYFVTDTNS